jgi:hypothetical protein
VRAPCPQLQELVQRVWQVADLKGGHEPQGGSHPAVSSRCHRVCWCPTGFHPGFPASGSSG